MPSHQLQTISEQPDELMYVKTTMDKNKYHMDFDEYVTRYHMYKGEKKWKQRKKGRQQVKTQLGK